MIIVIDDDLQGRVLAIPINCTGIDFVLVGTQMCVVIKYNNSFTVYIAPANSVVFLNGLKCKDIEKK